MAVDFDEAKIAREPAGLWLGWMLATALGLIVAYVPVAMFIGPLDLGIARVLVPLLAGLVIGVAQWLVLRRYLAHTFDWVFNLAASWVAGYTLGLIVVDLLANSFWGVVLSFILFGIIIALFQWPVLHREIRELWLWILANVAGWTLGALLSQWVIAALFGDNPASLVIITLVNMAVVGLVAGLITGLALMHIVRQPDLDDVVAERRR